MHLLENKPPQMIGLIGHTIIDYPTPSDALEIVDILVQNNVELIELQIPFSEPIADGPLFAKANYDAVKNGVTISKCYDFMSKVTAKYSIPFVFMTYANIVFREGYSQFVKNAKKAGAKGAIIPDLPFDIAKDYLKICKQENFAAIPVVSPNISEKRLQEISPFFEGFIYAVARAGVTGTKTEFDLSVINYIKELKRHTELPIAVGFGISSGEDLSFLRGSADYAVIGSQTLRVFEKEGLKGVRDFWQELNKWKNN